MEEGGVRVGEIARNEKDESHITNVVKECLADRIVTEVEVRANQRGGQMVSNLR